MYFFQMVSKKGLGNFSVIKHKSSSIRALNIKKQCPRKTKDAYVCNSKLQPIIPVWGNTQ